MLKRITCTLGLLGLSFAAFAGMPGNNMVPPSGVVLNAPDSGSGWSVGIEGLYVQPTGNNYQYSQINNGGALQNQSVDNSYQWGGEADATYHFKGNSRDVTLGYTHLDADESDTTHLNSGETFEQTVAVSPDSAKGETDNDYNAVDLTFGQQFLVGDRLVLHPFGGVRYIDLDQDDKVTYSDSADTADVGSEKIDSDFQGAGPEAGMDLRVLLGAGVSIVGTFSGALLVGDTDSHGTFAPSAATLLVPAEWDNDQSIHLVPELSARVGLDYTPHKIFPAASMGFQIGYQVVQYFNVADLDYFDGFAVNSVNNLDSYGYQGPYARLQLNIA